MTDPLSRLSAALDEDERMARAARDFPYDDPSDAPWVGMQIQVDRGVAMTSDAHFARHAPARVLRQVEALRKVIEEELKNLAALDGEFGDGCTPDEIRAGRCPGSSSALLAALAGIYIEPEESTNG